MRKDISDRIKFEWHRSRQLRAVLYMLLLTLCLILLSILSKMDKGIAKIVVDNNSPISTLTVLGHDSLERDSLIISHVDDSVICFLPKNLVSSHAERRTAYFAFKPSYLNKFYLLSLLLTCSLIMFLLWYIINYYIIGRDSGNFYKDKGLVYGSYSFFIWFVHTAIKLRYTQDGNIMYAIEGIVNVINSCFLLAFISYIDEIPEYLKKESIYNYFKPGYIISGRKIFDSKLYYLFIFQVLLYVLVLVIKNEHISNILLIILNCLTLLFNTIFIFYYSFSVSYVFRKWIKGDKWIYVCATLLMCIIFISQLSLLEVFARLKPTIEASWVVIGCTLFFKHAQMSLLLLAAIIWSKKKMASYKENIQELIKELTNSIIELKNEQITNVETKEEANLQFLDKDLAQYNEELRLAYDKDEEKRQKADDRILLRTRSLLHCVKSLLRDLKRDLKKELGKKQIDLADMNSFLVKFQGIEDIFNTIYQHNNRSDDKSFDIPINLNELLEKIVEVMNIVTSPHKIELNIKHHLPHTDIHNACYFIDIITELLTNAYKHGDKVHVLDSSYIKSNAHSFGYAEVEIGIKNDTYVFFVKNRLPRIKRARETGDGDGTTLLTNRIEKDLKGEMNIQESNGYYIFSFSINKKQLSNE